MKPNGLLKLLCIFLLCHNTLIAEPISGETSISSDELERAQPAYVAAISDVLKNFKRRVTILEIGRTAAEYTFALTPFYKAIWVALLVEGGATDV